MNKIKNKMLKIARDKVRANSPSPVRKAKIALDKAIDEHIERERPEFCNVCYECGVTANVVTCLVKYHNVPKKIHFTMSTYHEAKCDFCKKKKMVTETRDFFYPNFKLLKDVIAHYKELVAGNKTYKLVDRK